jgi:hypothetical protein
VANRNLPLSSLFVTSDPISQSLRGGRRLKQGDERSRHPHPLPHPHSHDRDQEPDQLPFRPVWVTGGKTSTEYMFSELPQIGTSKAPAAHNCLRPHHPDGADDDDPQRDCVFLVIRRLFVGRPHAAVGCGATESGNERAGIERPRRIFTLERPNRRVALAKVPTESGARRLQTAAPPFQRCPSWMTSGSGRRLRLR